MTQDEADSLHVAHELALDDAQREMSDFGETIGSCLMSSSSSSSSSFSISTAIEVAAMASYITMSAVATIASWLPTVLEVARIAYIAQRNSWDSLWLTELPARATPEFQFKERFLAS